MLFVFNYGGGRIIHRGKY